MCQEYDCILWYDKDMKQPYLNVTLCEVWVSEWKAYCNGQTYAILDKSPTMMCLEKEKEKSGGVKKGLFGGAGGRFAKCMFSSQFIPIFHSGFHLLQEAGVFSATGHCCWWYLATDPEDSNEAAFDEEDLYFCDGGLCCATCLCSI